VEYLSKLDVLRIHGSLLAIGELTKTLSEDDISKDSSGLYQVLPLLFPVLIVGYSEQS
jgi:hypothetical protein